MSKISDFPKCFFLSPSKVKANVFPICKRAKLLEERKKCLPGMFDVLGVSEASPGLQLNEQPRLVQLLELTENAWEQNNCRLCATECISRDGLCVLTIGSVTGIM